MSNKHPQPKVEWPDDPSGGEFERMCFTIFSKRYESPTSYYYGSRGQKQYGIDLCVTNQISTGIDFGKFVYIQCKDCKNLTTDIIKKEINAFWGYARNKPNVSEYIIATTYPEDNKLQEAAEKLRHDLGCNFSIKVMGRKTLETIISEDDEINKCFTKSQINPIKPSHDLNILINYLVDKTKNKKYKLHLERINKVLKIKPDGRDYLIPTLDSPDIKPWELPEELVVCLFKLYMEVTDVKGASSLIDHLLGSWMYRASYLVDYLRLKRISTHVKICDKSPAGTFSDILKENKEFIEHAQGSNDDVLTLAYFSVFYCESDESIMNGFRRALQAITSSRKLSTNAFHTIEIAYAVIRAIFIKRVNGEACLNIEADYPELSHSFKDGGPYERRSHSPCDVERSEKDSMEIFPNFWQEVNRARILSRVECPYELNNEKILRYPRSDGPESHFRSRLEYPLKRPKQRACTYDVLIADELHHSAHLRKNISLVTTTQSVERLLCITRALSLGLYRWFPRIYNRYDGYLTDEMSAECAQNLISAIHIRPLPSSHYGVGIVAYPAYFDFENDDGKPVDELTQVISLATDKEVPVLFASLREYRKLEELRTNDFHSSNAASPRNGALVFMDYRHKMAAPDKNRGRTSPGNSDNAA